MTARSLLLLFDAVYLLALASWLGGLLFVTFGMPRAEGGAANDLASRLYVWGATSGAIALPALLGGPVLFPTELRSPSSPSRPL